ncbi:hypothetical protein ACXYWI_03730, partial [Mesomycoplasma ovipneumoniae]
MAPFQGRDLQAREIRKARRREIWKKRGNFKKSAGKSVKDGATGSGNTSQWRQGVTATSLPELGLAGRQGVRVN